MARLPVVTAAGWVITLVSALAAQAPTAPRAPSAKVTLAAPVTSLGAVIGSSTVVAGMADGSVSIWNGRDPAPTATQKPHASRVVAVGAKSNDEIWTVAEDGSLAHSAGAGGAKAAVSRVDVGKGTIRAAAFSSDGALLATGGEFGELRVFHTSTGAIEQKIQGHRTELHYLAIRSGPPVLVSASAEADLRVWDISTGRELWSMDLDLALFALTFNPRNGALASGGVGRRLTFHDPTTFRPAHSMTLPRPRMVATLAWSPDGRRIAVGDIDDESLSKGGVQILDVKSRQSVAELDTGRTPATAVVFAADHLVVAAVGRELRAWSVR